MSAVSVDPSQPQVIGTDLAALIDLANIAMQTPVHDVELRLSSPHDLDAGRDDTAPLPPGVRRIILTINRPDGLLVDVESPETLRLVFMLCVFGSEPNMQLDVETLLRWVARVESAAGETEGAARDLADPGVVRGLARDRGEARLVSEALKGACQLVNSVADEAREAVADTRTWLPIAPTDTVFATVHLRRARVHEVAA